MKNLKPFKNAKKMMLIAIILPCLYSTFVLSFVWWHCYTSAFNGGGNGQLDAYRHTFASAVVSYTLSLKLVSLISLVMENKNGAGNLMDKHNNIIGAQIGSKSQSLTELNTLVIIQTQGGRANASSPTQVTWLPAKYWAKRLFW